MIIIQSLIQTTLCMSPSIIYLLTLSHKGKLTITTLHSILSGNLVGTILANIITLNTLTH